MEDPATKYLLTKDPLFSFMGTGAIPDSSVNYLAASTGNPLQALALAAGPRPGARLQAAPAGRVHVARAAAYEINHA